MKIFKLLCVVVFILALLSACGNVANRVTTMDGTSIVGTGSVATTVDMNEISINSSLQNRQGTEESIATMNTEIKKEEIETYEDEPEYDEMNDEDILRFYTIELGSYQDTISKRATLAVSFKDGKYEFEINWASSAFENTKWVFSGVFDKDNNKVNYVNEKKYMETFDNAGKKTTKQVLSNGYGFMKYENDKLYWVDGQEERIYDDDYNGIFEFMEK